MLVGLLGVAAAPASAHGNSGDVYVSEHGYNSAGCGTEARPCRTINHGIGVARPDYTVHVGPARTRSR